jgi:hypothetical protein
MRKGYIYYKDPRDNTSVKPRQGQYYLALDQNGLIGVHGGEGQPVAQTQFIGTGATAPGQYLPLAGGTVTGPVLFKGNITATNPFVISNTLNVTSTISSGGTDLSQLFAPYGSSGEAFSGGTISGDTYFTSTISSGGTDLSQLFAPYGSLGEVFSGGTISGATDFTSTISSGGTDLSILFGSLASGVAVIDFGTGSMTTSLVVNEATVTTASTATVFTKIEATPEHSVSDLLIDPIRLSVDSFTEGVGFTIIGTMDNAPANGTYMINWKLN